MNLRKLLFSLTPMSLMAATTVDVNTTAYPTLENFVTLRDALNSANDGPDTNVIQFDQSIFGGTINLTEDNPILNTLPVTSLTIGQSGANMTFNGQNGFQLLGFAPAIPTSFSIQGITFQNGSFNVLNNNAAVTLGNQVVFGPNSTIQISGGSVIGALNLNYSSNFIGTNSGSINGLVSATGSNGSLATLTTNNFNFLQGINLNANSLLTIDGNTTVSGTINAIGADVNHIASIQVTGGTLQFPLLQLNGNSLLTVSGNGLIQGPIVLNGSSPIALAQLDYSSFFFTTPQVTFNQYGAAYFHDATLAGNYSIVNNSQLKVSDADIDGLVTIDSSSTLSVLSGNSNLNQLVNQGTMQVSSLLTTSTYQNSGLLQISLNSPSSGLVETSVAQLGGTVQIAPGSIFFVKGSIAPIINYQTIAGTDSLALSPFDQQRIQIVTPLSYNYPGPSDPADYANSIYLLLKANYIGNTQFSGNAGVVQTYLQYASLNPDLTQVITAINLLPTNQVQATALDQLSPAHYGAFDWTSGALMNQIATLVAKQGICNCSCSENQYLWVAATGQFLNQKTIEELHGFDGDAWGVFGGYERQVGDSWSLGLMTGYSDDYIKWHTKYGNSHLQQATVGFHANYCDEEQLDIDALVIAGYQHYSSNRFIGFSGLPTRRAESTTDGWIATGRFQMEKAFDDNSWIFIPFGFIEYTYMQRASMQEKGAGSLNLFVHRHDASFFRAEIGPSIARTLFFSWVTFTPMFRFGWNWIVPTSGKRFKAELAGQDQTMTVLSTKQVLNFPAAELSLVCDFCWGLDLILSYENQFASQFNNQNVTCELAWEF